ncbi:hypothetical protein ACLOJK_023606 [Asimina triloba]
MSSMSKLELELQKMQLEKRMIDIQLEMQKKAKNEVKLIMPSELQTKTLLEAPAEMRSFPKSLEAPAEMQSLSKIIRRAQTIHLSKGKLLLKGEKSQVSGSKEHETLWIYPSRSPGPEEPETSFLAAH